MTVTCLHPHERESLVEVDWLDWWTRVLGCEACGREFMDDEHLTPVAPAESVAEAIDNEERTGWDGQRERLLSSDPYWSGVLDGPR